MQEFTEQNTNIRRKILLVIFSFLYLYYILYIYIFFSLNVS